jgi:hypothetical protein
MTCLELLVRCRRVELDERQTEMEIGEEVLRLSLASFSRPTYLPSAADRGAAIYFDTAASGRKRAGAREP